MSKRGLLRFSSYGILLLALVGALGDERSNIPPRVCLWVILGLGVVVGAIAEGVRD